MRIKYGVDTSAVHVHVSVQPEYALLLPSVWWLVRTCDDVTTVTIAVTVIKYLDPQSSDL